MATEIVVQDVSRIAAADLSSYQYYFVQLSAAKTVNIAEAADADLYGILQNKPAAANRAAKVRRLGQSQLKLGAAVSTVGTKLTSDANGKGTSASAGERYGAVALETGSSGDIIAVEMEIGYVPAE